MSAILNIQKGLEELSLQRKKAEAKAEVKNNHEKEQLANKTDIDSLSVEELAKLPAEEQIKLLSGEVLRLTDLLNQLQRGAE